jgi:hypothetical protein
MAAAGARIDRGRMGNARVRRRSAGHGIFKHVSEDAYLGKTADLVY